MNPTYTTGHDPRLVWENNRRVFCSADTEQDAERIVAALNGEETLVRVLDALERAASLLDDGDEADGAVWEAIYHLKKHGVMNTLADQATAAIAAVEEGT